MKQLLTLLDCQGLPRILTVAANSTEQFCAGALQVAERLLQEVVVEDHQDEDGIALASGLAQMVAMTEHSSDLAAAIQQHCKVAESLQELKSSMQQISGDVEDKMNALKACNSSFTSMMSHHSALPASPKPFAWTSEVDSMKAKIAEIAQAVIKQKLSDISAKADAVGGGAVNKSCWKSSLSAQPQWQEIETAAQNLISAPVAKLLDSTLKTGNAERGVESPRGGRKQDLITCDLSAKARIRK